jgi:hypothetical protein
MVPRSTIGSYLWFVWCCHEASPPPRVPDNHVPYYWSFTLFEIIQLFQHQRTVISLPIKQKLYFKLNALKSTHNSTYEVRECHLLWIIWCFKLNNFELMRFCCGKIPGVTFGMSSQLICEVLEPLMDTASSTYI